MKMRKVTAALIFLVLLNFCSATGDTDGTCSVDDDCSYLYACQQNTCVHKDLFPITFREVGGTVLILLFNSIITVNCVGAADAYVPYLSLIFKHTFRKSFFLEFACLLGGELGNILNIARFRDPRNKRYMINFEVNMVIVPALMIGGHIGALISGLLAPFVANLIFIAALCLCIYRNIRGLRANLKKEKEAKIVRAFKIPEESQKMNDLTSSKDTLRPSPFASFRAENDSNSADVSKIFPIQPNSPVMPSSPVFSSSPGAQAVEDASLMPPSEDNRQPENGEALELSEIVKKRNKIIEKEQSFPFYKLREIMINAVIIVVISLIRGSKTFTPIVGVEWNCKWEFLWFGVGILVFGLNMSRSIYLIRKWQKEKVAVGYEFPPGDPLLTKKNFIHLILRSILSGCIGPTIFLGGAAVTGPLVTDMGIPADYFESTADVITIFAAFNAMFKGTVYGVITWQEVMWFLPLGFVCSFFSSKLATWYVRKTGKQSTNILTLVVISMIGLVGLLAIFIKSLVDNFDQQIVFNNVC